jgi:hypothetical protein
MGSESLAIHADWGTKILGGYFDEVKHLYRNERGVIIPSTTQVFDILGCTDFSGIPLEILEWKRNYGLAVHKAFEFLVVNDLDWETLDEAIIPAVTGIEAFLKKIEYFSEVAEERRIHTLFGMEFGLTVDGRGSMVHQGIRRHVIVDLKSGAKASPTWKWQLGGYTVAQDKVDGGWMGLVIQFNKEGNIVPHYVDLLKAKREFQILLSAAILKLNSGLGKIRGDS